METHPGALFQLYQLLLHNTIIMYLILSAKDAEL